MYKAYIENYLKETIQIAGELSQEEIEKGARLLTAVRERGGRLFILGVGGSAANASHAVNDFRKIGGIESYAPTDNVSEFSARANDEGWHTTFAEWLKTSRLSEKDVLLVLSVGGGSEKASGNIVEALKLAGERKAGIVSIVSRDGGYAGQTSDACIRIPVIADERITPHAEGWQGIIWHLLVNAITADRGHKSEG